MLGEGPEAALSVRAVAARAGVSTGSLRHHFPTQRELMDEMLAKVYDLVMPEDGLRATDVPARTRLFDSLTGLLAPRESAGAREAWVKVHERYIAVEPTQAIRAEYRAMHRVVRRRLEASLLALEEEGAVPPGDVRRRAHFLLTVVNGVSVEQALPGGEERIADGIEALRAAVDCVVEGHI